MTRRGARWLHALGLCAGMATVAAVATVATVAMSAMSARADGAPVLSLAQALQTARTHAPELYRARAESAAARARIDAARAPLLPQVSGSASYELATTNTPARSSVAAQDNWSFGVQASQLLYDFGQTRGLYQAAKHGAQAAVLGEQSARVVLELQVRVAYFSAGAARALLGVAQETLENRERHLARIHAFVEVGSRPAIDLAQAKTDVATSRLAVLRAENAYALAKAELASAMGERGPSNFEVGLDLLAAVHGEDAPAAALLAEAHKTRPELAARGAQVRAQELRIAATLGGYGPSLSLGAGVSEAGRYLSDLSWNARAGVTLAWPLFQGGITDARASEARAELLALRAQLETERNAIALSLEQARLSLQTARAAIGVADEVVINAREQLRLAEGRYDAGAGHVIELGDAQLAVAGALSERVRADYDLAIARARLIAALGR